MNNISNNIKTLRDNKGLTQDGLAQILREQYGQDTVRTTVIRWENGDSEPKLDTLRCLARIFGKSMDEIAGDEPIKELSSNQKALIHFVEKSDDAQIKKLVDIAKIIDKE